MKYWSLALLMIVLYPAAILSDVLPEDSHVVDRQVIITNLHEVPDMWLIGYITGPNLDGYELDIVKKNVPLSKGYKFNDYALFALTRDLLVQAGGVDHIDFEAIAKILKPAEIIDPGDTYVSDENPLEAEFFYYQVTVLSQTRMVLELVQRVQKYNDGSPDRVISY